MSVPIFFAAASDLRRWLARNGRTCTELWVGFYKKDSGLGGITYREALDEALCAGWIDGVRKRVDDTSYMNRFSPRRKRSNWSLVNIRRAEELSAQGRMRRDGLKAFAARDVAAARTLDNQRRYPELDAAMLRRFKANARAWTFFQAMPAANRRNVTFWVTSAKREETRLKRLDELIVDFSAGRRRGQMVLPKGHGGTKKR